MINRKFSLENVFQEILYRIDNWINQGSGWNVVLTESQYINISTYRPLPGGFYVKLPAELRSSKKGLINIKNIDQKCFLWCHIVMGFGFLFKKMILPRLKQKKPFALMCFVTKIG